MSEAIVETRQGKVRGTALGPVMVWKGVPFTQPPIGALRFRPPQPLEAWSGVRDATRFGPIAPQGTLRVSGLFGSAVAPEPASEDCLYLNIWSPQADDKKRPVMVWIHDGAFILGSGSMPLYDGASFAVQGDVVVVTINYRLGALGFLHLGELAGDQYASSGNNGLLDQVAALSWVRANIEAFGGDPEAITVFGESVGAMSIGLLLAMPAAKGLFQRAILQSGAAHSVTEKQTATEIARDFLETLGLSTNEVAALVDLPLDELLAAQIKVLDKRRHFGMAPVADGTVLPARPIDAIAQGAAKDVTVLVGTNRDEMKLFFAGAQAATPDEHMLKQTFGPAATEFLATYTAARPDASPSDAWVDILTDRSFRIPAIRLAEQQAQHSPHVWMYRFDWATHAFGGRLGACHALELPFVWNNLDPTGLGALTGDVPNRQELADLMHSTWIAFAHTGDPNTPALPYWPTYDTDRRATMLFNNDCRVVNDPQSAERRLWQGVL